MKKKLAITLLVTCIIAVAGFTVYWLETQTKSEDSSVNPHYLTYNGVTSKIYLTYTVTSFGNSNDTYTTPDGQIVEKGTPLFVITLTLRNDYTSDNPAPPLHNQDQTSPADGTAYLYLTTKLYDKGHQLNATNVSVSDFSLPTVPGTGLVLSSGETASAKIYMSTTQTNIDKYEVNLYFLGDSIPTSNP
jgi:hypothetical protein